MPIYILQSIALCFSKSRSCKRKDILNIYRNVAGTKEDFERKWREMTNIYFTSNCPVRKYKRWFWSNGTR